MRTTVLTILTCLVLLLLDSNDCLSGPPLSGEGSGKASWMNPAEWSMPKLPPMPTMPKMPWSGEPARIKKKSPGVMDSMKGTAKSGWNKTKRALDPTRMFNSDAKPAPKKTESKAADGGFFSGMFKSEKEDKEIRTVNDFLSQPQPR